MRVRARIPAVDITVMQPPELCPYEDCKGRYFKNHQAGCLKPARDTRIEVVETCRRRCVTCGRTHRVYPQGVSKAHQSDRLKGLSVRLYLLGISYRGVEDLLRAPGYVLDHTTVYLNVQAAGQRVQQLRRAWLAQGGGKVSVVGGDLTPRQLLEDLAELEWILLGHPGNAERLLAKLYDRYSPAPAPKKGRRASVWYRMHNQVLRLWNHWQRYTCYRGAGAETQREGKPFYPKPKDLAFTGCFNKKPVAM